MTLRETSAYHIENLMDISPDAQVVELTVAERLEQENAALKAELEAVKKANDSLRMQNVYYQGVLREVSERSFKIDPLRSYISSMRYIESSANIQGKKGLKQMASFAIKMAEDYANKIEAGE